MRILTGYVSECCLVAGFVTIAMKSDFQKSWGIAWSAKWHLAYSWFANYRTWLLGTLMVW